MTRTLVFFLNLRGLASRAVHSHLFFLLAIVGSFGDRIDRVGAEGSETHRSEGLFFAIHRIGGHREAAPPPAPPPPPPPPPPLRSAAGRVPADAGDLSGLRPAQARAESRRRRPRPTLRFSPSRVSYSRCWRRPVTTTRLPLLRLVAAFSPRSPQATTLKNDTCSLPFVVDLVRRRLTARPSAGDSDDHRVRETQFGIAREVADQRDAVSLMPCQFPFGGSC